MKVLQVNKFLYPKGGDAICTLATGEILRAGGHEVLFWGMHHPANPDYPTAPYFTDYVDYENTRGVKGNIRMALNLLYSREAKVKISRLIDNEKPDIAHLHNIYHHISPSIIYALKEKRVPVVMTLHDYKLTCPVYTLLRDGRVCGECTGGRFYRAAFNRCTKGSRLKSALNSLEMYLHHRVLHIYEKVDVFISPSKFLMEKTKEMGFLGSIVHLQNFVDPGLFEPSYDPGGGEIVYFGRLSEEKGVDTLIEAVEGLDVRLEIIGDGPQRGELEKAAAGNVRFLGYRTGAELPDEIKRSMFVVTPSEWYENNPRSIIEAFALGKPVIGARIGGIPELVRDGVTGLTFEPGNARDLREKILFMLEEKDAARKMGMNARAFVERGLDPETHFKGLMHIYEDAINGRSGSA
jgi:glycosyltransferase involved in cell wall biosynthesis